MHPALVEPSDRIIFALDVHDAARALALVEQLQPHIGCFKIGLEFIHAMIASILHPKRCDQDVARIRDLFAALQGNVFWDGKLHDIPNTVAAASGLVAEFGVRMLNVHTAGGIPMMREAKLAVERACKQGSLATMPLVLGVTVLTSLGYEDLVETGVFDPLDFPQPQVLHARHKEYIHLLVRQRALAARASGLDGVICSPEEVSMLRKACGQTFTLVTPGIRPAWARTNDQKRIMTPGDAIRAGADYLVIGRPIADPPSEIGSPVEAAKRIADEIAEALAKKECA